MKVLVTGDRSWNDIEIIAKILESLPKETTVIHGAHQSGANTIAGECAKQLGFNVVEYPANWSKFGGIAGSIRNQEILDCEHNSDKPINLCLAFHNDLKSSRETKDMINRAKAAGIPVTLISSKK